MAHSSSSSGEVEVYSADFTIPHRSGIYFITKGSAAAITLTAPVNEDGIELIIMSASSWAHVITATSLVWDGTTGVNTTGTFQAFAGACTTLIAKGSLWLVKSSNNVAWT